MVAGLVSSLSALTSSALSMSSCCCRPCGHRRRVDVAPSSSAVGPARLGWYHEVVSWWVLRVGMAWRRGEAFARRGDASGEGELACGEGRKPWARVWQSGGGDDEVSMRGQTEWREPPRDKSGSPR
ncbi:hypothetical protein EDB83DRAFT_2387373 [Lactarius deliciosus]|nr:hypothetical protein EDB83DRAFT_2387373 [Lactarius deliciosus]